MATLLLSFQETIMRPAETQSKQIPAQQIQAHQFQVFLDDYKRLINSIEPLRNQFSSPEQLFDLLGTIS